MYTEQAWQNNMRTTCVYVLYILTTYSRSKYMFVGTFMYNKIHDSPDRGS
jgi:hypothetical protein